MTFRVRQNNTETHQIDNSTIVFNVQMKQINPRRIIFEIVKIEIGIDSCCKKDEEFVPNDVFFLSLFV